MAGLKAPLIAGAGGLMTAAALVAVLGTEPAANSNFELSRCLVPRCAGVCYGQLKREGLWDKFYMDAPARQWRC
ncbi:MAG: hypothetical protein ACREDD_13975, partial [Methylocella sp.]